MSYAWKLLTFLWPFILEFCMGRRTGFMEAYKTKPRQFFIAVGLFFFSTLATLGLIRLYTLSNEMVLKNAEIQQLRTQYNELAKKHGEPVLIGGAKLTPAPVSVLKSPKNTLAPTATVSSAPVEEDHSVIIDELHRIQKDVEK